MRHRTAAQLCDCATVQRRNRTTAHAAAAARGARSNLSRRLMGRSCSELSPAIACDPRTLPCDVRPDLWLERSLFAVCCACPSVPHIDRTSADHYRRCRSARTVYSQRTSSAGVLPFRHYSNLSSKKTLFHDCVSHILAARASATRAGAGARAAARRGGRARHATWPSAAAAHAAGRDPGERLRGRATQPERA
jgi:hypothetical protein